MTDPKLTDRLLFLYEAARTLSTSLKTHDVLQVLMSLTHEHFQPDAVSVAIVEPEGYLVFRAASGKSAQDVVGMTLPAGTGIVGWVAKHGKTLWVPKTKSDGRHYNGVDRKTGFHTDAIYAVPVKVGEQTLAVLELVNPLPETSLSELEEVMPALASLAASAIQNARLFEQVQQTEERYQRLFDLNLDPIIILDPEGNLLEINQAARDLLPLSEEDKGRSCLAELNITPPRFHEMRERARDGDVVTWEFSVPAKEGGASPRVLDVNMSYLSHYSPNGAYQWLGHDVTDRVALEQMRQQLADMIVHDLRNPLGSITNSLELLHAAWVDQDDTVPIGQVLGIALRSSQRMERLISDILDMARLQSQEKTISIAETELPPLIDEVLETLMPSAKRRNHTIEENIQSDLPPLWGDQDVIRRVLLNIMTNAIKYTPNGGTITLTVRADADEFYFAVADSGPGIPPEERQHIFEPFVRVDSDNVKGAGLGLAFCKLAVEAHEGEIGLDSTLGEGSTFYFTIPRNLDESELTFLEEVEEETWEET